jgi:hypothetical protein
MLNTSENKYIKFIKKWKYDLPNKNVLFDYKHICNDLLYQKEEILQETVNLLKTNIDLWAKKNSKIYEFKNQIINKENLLNKKTWYVDEMKNESAKMKTSGSTSKPFYYLRWNYFLDFIECENHYNLVLNEFNIKDNFNLMYFFDNEIYSKTKKITVNKNPKNFMEKHGTKNAIVHYVNFSLLQKSIGSFYKFIISYCIKNNIDVIYCPGSVTNSLCHYIKKYKIKNKICNLLSNSYEQILKSDIDFLIENNIVNNVCNHMRCWDGGATFFTCKYNTYHLLDNLSWCDEYENKLISTDYFSFPSPFVNYWNGDYCEIKSNYKRCECGRLYRPFKFLQSRPFAIKGYIVHDIYNNLIKLEINSIKQIKCDYNNIIIISNKEIELEKKNIMKKQFEKINFKFIVE